MIFYFIIWLVLYFFSFLEILGLKRSDCRNLFLLASLFLFLLSFLRWETGTDWIGYYSYFDRLQFWNQESEFEFSFARINEFVKLVFNNYTVLLLVFSCIIFFFQTQIIYKYSPLPLLSLFFLWSISFANVFYIRQTISTIILLFATSFIIEKKKWLFFFFVFIAASFHITAYVFLISYFIFNIRVRIKYMFVFLLLSFLLSSVISLLFNNIAPMLGSIYQHKLDVYLALGDSGETMTSSSMLETLIRGIGNKVFIFVLLISFSSNSLKNDYIFRGYLNLYWFGAILYFLTVSISIVFIRFSFAFDIVQIILIPMLFYDLSRKNKYILFTVITIFLLFRFYITLFGNYYELYVPYKTIFTV